MTLSRTKPIIDCKTSSKGNGKGFIENEIRIGEHYVNVEDFCEVVMYFLTNTDLEDQDPRLALVSRVKGLGFTQGWNDGNLRFDEPQGGKRDAVR